MIYYFLIAAFAMGTFVGSIIHESKKPTIVEGLILFLLGLFWPFIIFVYVKDWVESRK